MEILSPFYKIVENPETYVKTWKDQNNGKIVGFFCSYVPEEIIFAGGALPYRIFNSSEQVALADAHFQAYSCSIVRGALEDALSGRLDFLDGAVFSHTCDSMQRLSDIWRINTGFDFHTDLVLPVNLLTESARQYMTEVIQKFRTDMEKGLNVVISSENLKVAVEKYNRIRSYLKRIYEIRCENPELISSTDVQAIVNASMIMDRNSLLEHLSDILPILEKRREKKSGTRKRIVLSGGVCTFPDIYKVIEESGGAVVWDDLCTGSRYFDHTVCDEENDPVKSIVQRYTARAICPSKHSGLFSRGEHIKAIVKESGAQGVLFLLIKFCDPHFFDIPYIREFLKKEGIASMVVEIEDSAVSGGQFKTKCEAFLEML